MILKICIVIIAAFLINYLAVRLIHGNITARKSLLFEDNNDTITIENIDFEHIEVEYPDRKPRGFRW